MYCYEIYAVLSIAKCPKYYLVTNYGNMHYFNCFLRTFLNSTGIIIDRRFNETGNARGAYMILVRQ